MIGIGRRAGRARRAQRATLPALACICHRGLPGAAPHTPCPCSPTPSRAWFIIVNMQARPPLAWPTSQPVASLKCMTQVGEAWMPILCSIEPHATPLRAAGVAVGVRQQLRHQEQADAARTGRRIDEPREHQVHDVARQVVLAAADEDLGTGDPAGAVAAGLGTRAQQPEIRAAVRLGETHRAGPLSGDHLRQVARLEVLAGVRFDRVRGTLGQARVHLPGHVPGDQHLAETEREATGQPLPAPARVLGHRDPAVAAIALVGVLEAGRRAHAPGFEDEPVLVAHPVGRRQDVLGEPRAFFEDALEQLTIEILAAKGPVVLLEIEHFVHDEADVTKWGAVGMHESSRSGAVTAAFYLRGSSAMGEAPGCLPSGAARIVDRDQPSAPGCLSRNQ